MNNSVWNVGELQAEFEDGGLRYVRYRGVELVRGIYAAVRDRDWGTVPPVYRDVRAARDDAGVTIAFVCEHAKDDIDFVWEGNIRLKATGLRFDFEGRARSSFLRNRIGFCVLHPMEFAGLAVDVLTDEGVVRDAFPRAISPHQPFRSIRSIRCEPASGLRTTLTFEGEMFEMEDQRNWTDASFKTYCTPLDRPFPVRVEAGDIVRQSVALAVDVAPAASVGSGPGRGSAHRIVLREERSCRLPDIGLGLAETPPTPADAALLASLRPDHWRLDLDLTSRAWRRRLEEANAAGSGSRNGLELEAIAADGASWRELARFVAERGIRVCRLLPFRPGAFASDAETVAAAKRAFAEAGLRAATGGGSRAYYAEFNRAQLPFAAMEFAAYPMNPQVHAFDDRSLMETHAAQRVTAEDASAKSGLPLFVGPITFKPRVNPNATSGRSPTPEEMRDDRLRTSFGAAWTIGCLAALCVPDVRGVTLFESVGPIGLIEDGTPAPAFGVIRDATEYAGADVLRVEGAPASVAALALRAEAGAVRVLLSNRTSADVEVSLETGERRVADVRAYGDGACAAVPANAAADVSADGVVSVKLEPYGCVRIDLRKPR